MQHKRVETGAREGARSLRQTLIFTRFLGHTVDIPGSAQWKMITAQPKGHNDCWVCDRHIYSLIFWNKRIGAIGVQQVPREDQEYILGKIREFAKEEDSGAQKSKAEAEHSDTPYIYGSFTNWKPRRMFEIREYCDRINADKPNVFLRCKDQGYIRRGVTDTKDLNEEEKITYEKNVKEYFDSYLNSWKMVIIKNLKYKRPNLVNANMKLCFSIDEPLYVFATFMTAGKHFYNIEVRGKDKSPQNWVHSCIAKFRNEPIIPSLKETKMKVVDRVFKKEHSVFDKWVEDTDVLLAKSFEAD